MDLRFQSIAGTEPANSSFGVTVPMLLEANEAGAGHFQAGHCRRQRRVPGNRAGSVLSAHRAPGDWRQPVDQQTLKPAPTVWRARLNHC